MTTKEALTEATKMSKSWVAPPHLCEVALDPEDTVLSDRQRTKIELVKSLGVIAGDDDAKKAN